MLSRLSQIPSGTTGYPGKTWYHADFFTLFVPEKRPKTGLHSAWPGACKRQCPTPDSTGRIGNGASCILHVMGLMFFSFVPFTSTRIVAYWVQAWAIFSPIGNRFLSWSPPQTPTADMCCWWGCSGVWPDERATWRSCSCGPDGLDGGGILPWRRGTGEVGGCCAWDCASPSAIVLDQNWVCIQKWSTGPLRKPAKIRGSQVLKEIDSCPYRHEQSEWSIKWGWNIKKVMFRTSGCHVVIVVSGLTVPFWWLLSLSTGASWRTSLPHTSQFGVIINHHESSF